LEQAAGHNCDSLVIVAPHPVIVGIRCVFFFELAAFGLQPEKFFGLLFVHHGIQCSRSAGSCQFAALRFVNLGQVMFGASSVSAVKVFIQRAATIFALIVNNLDAFPTPNLTVDEAFFMAG
jgi:hypothetical protein